MMMYEILRLRRYLRGIYQFTVRNLGVILISILIRRYERLATRHAVEAIPGFQWCLRPNCSSGQVHESADDAPIMMCVDCGFSMCVVHNTAWHEGRTCEEQDRVNQGIVAENEERSRQVIASTSKPCPGSCGFNITKIDGCDHMTCQYQVPLVNPRHYEVGALLSLCTKTFVNITLCIGVRCRFEFCWVCRAPYNDSSGIRTLGNRAHAQTCPHYRYP